MKYLIMFLIGAVLRGAEIPTQETVKISKQTQIVSYDPKTDKLNLISPGSWEDASYAILELVKQCESRVASMNKTAPEIKRELKK